MPTSTNGQICFGILFGEDQEFPWDDETGVRDFDDWYIDNVLGFSDPSPYDENGEYLEGKTEKDGKEYIEKRNPLGETIPFSLVNYCSGAFPMYILAIKDTEIEARRGCPEKLTPSSLVVDPFMVEKLREFVQKYNIEYEEEPTWYLSSYWSV